eukprot:276853_1
MGCKCSKERTQKYLSAAARRKHLASHPLIVERRQKIPDNISVIREYVDTGKGRLISTACFLPKSTDKELKGMIMYCQGYSSFTDWTDTDCGINFVNRGYIFITHDHYGHGRSDGDWLTNPTSDWTTYVDDANYIFERAKRKFTPKKYIENNKKFHYFLLGHSLGGAIAIELSKAYTSSSYYLDVCKRFQNVDMKEDINDRDSESDEKSPLRNHDHDISGKKQENKNDFIPKSLLKSYCNYDHFSVNNNEKDSLFGWDGMILSAPMVKLKDGMKPPDWLINMASYLVPLLPDARIVPTKSLADKLTRDEGYFQFIQKSPMFYDDRPALRTGFVLMNFSTHIEHTMDKVKLPVFILHGEEDRITDPDMSQLFYDKCSSKDKK